MRGKIGSMLATGIGLVLLGYTAYRSWDFVAMTLPPDKQVVAYFALAALDGGIIAWLLSYLYGSRGAWQRSIALIMVIVDFAGAVLMFSLDTLYTAGEAGLVAALDPNTMRTAMLALSGVIAANIGATIAHHMLDPEQLRRQAEEAAQDKIEEASLKLIDQNAQQLAAQIAPQVASSWRDGIVAEYGHRLKKPRDVKQLPAELPTQPEEEPNPTRRRKSKD